MYRKKIFNEILPFVAIVILNWNGKILTSRCIKSIKRINYSNYKIVVVDNGSTDDSPSYIAKKFPDVLLLKNRKNLGFAGGMNIGIKHSIEVLSSDYILILNNDTIVDKYFLMEMIKAAQRDQKIAALQPKILFYDRKNVIQSAGRNFNLVLSLNRCRGSGKEDKGQYDLVSTMKSLDGVCILFKRHIFKEVGFFDEIFFANCEDIDIAIRIINAGYKIIYVPSALVWHVWAASVGGTWSPLKKYLNARNLPILAKKHTSKIEYFLFWFIFLFVWTPFFFGYWLINNKIRLFKYHIYGISDFLSKRRLRYDFFI